MASLRPRYHQILRPRRHLAKLANRLRRHADPLIHFHLHGIWQTAKRYLEGGKASWLVSHLGFLSLPFTPPKLYHLPGYLEVRNRGLLTTSHAAGASRNVRLYSKDEDDPASYRARIAVGRRYAARGGDRIRCRSACDGR